MAAFEGPRAWVARHRGPIITVCCGVIGLVLTVLGVALPWRLDIPVPAVGPSLLFLAAILAVHLGRRRRPLVMLALGTLVAVAEALTTGYSGIGVLVVLSDLAYAAALYSGSRIVDAVALACTALAVGSAGLLAVTWLSGGTGAVSELGDGLQFGWLLTAPILFASSIWFGRLVRYPRLEAQRERDRADAVERAAAALRQDAVTRQRLELSRELHDVIAGHLSAIAMQSTAALERRATDDAAPLRRSLELVRASSVDALADMRTMIDVLRGDQLPDGATEAPSRLNQEEIARAVAMAEANGLDVDLCAPATEALAAVPAQVSVVGLRTLLEGLTNAAKHAAAPRVQVTVDITGDVLLVAIANPVAESAAAARGAGAGSGGVGLIGLGERARLVGGELAAGSDGVTWRTVLQVPIDRARPHVAVLPTGALP